MKGDTTNMNPSQYNILENSWIRCWTILCPQNSGNSLKQKIIQLYNDPLRKYHTIQHLTECIELLQMNHLCTINVAEIEIAFWFHDAIYDLHATDNEERSADFAKQELFDANVSNEIISRIIELILVTKHASNPKYLDQMLMVDIDLSILGAPRSRYIEYENQIREEYTWVSESIFKENRKALLMEFLSRNKIYNTMYFQKNNEDQARKNLRFSIENILS